MILVCFYMSDSALVILTFKFSVSPLPSGLSGLYKGFWVSAFQLVSGISYITTYETVRHFLQQQGVRDSRIRAMAGGGCASLVGQTIIVPFDVISQHMMVLGQLERRGKTKVVVNPLRIPFQGRRKPQVGCTTVVLTFHITTQNLS